MIIVLGTILLKALYQTCSAKTPNLLSFLFATSFDLRKWLREPYQTEWFISLGLCVYLQVDYVIKDATNLNNLAVLYEGWTPWVWNSKHVTERWGQKSITHSTHMKGADNSVLSNVWTVGDRSGHGRSQG